MMRLVYVDGQYLPHRSATVHIEDRGYQFAIGLLPVVRIDGSGVPGPLSRRSREHHSAHVTAAA
ncbi:MAG TPA: hypothetical protein VF924_00980 [Stellaceae bacterium]|jgi:D-alanine transaminase